MENIKVYMTTSHHVTNYHNSLTVNEETHPELKGMTQEEMKTYIMQNAESMSPIDDSYESLYDELQQSEIQSDHWRNLDEGIEFEQYNSRL